MQQIQKETLKCEPVEDETAPGNTMRLPDKGPTVRWHADLANVPHGPSLIVAQELFDALPVHQFEYTDRCVCSLVSWRRKYLQCGLMFVTLCFGLSSLRMMQRLVRTPCGPRL